MAINRSKPGGIWMYSVYIPGSAYRLRGSTGTSDEAEAHAVEALLKMAAGKNTTRDRLLRIIDALYPVDPEVVDDVPLDAISIDLDRAVTISGKVPAKDNSERRRQNLDAFTEWTKKNWPAAKTLRGVDRKCAQSFAVWLAKHGKSSKTIRNRLGILSAIWNLLKRVHDDLENPWPLAMPAPTNGNRGEAFTPDEARRIFEAGDRQGLGWGLAARIAACTGLRKGDVLRLKFEDISNGVLRIKPHKTTRFEIETVLPLPPDVADLIGHGSGYIFPILAAEYKRYARQPHPFKDVLKLAGVDSDKYTFHSFRHYFRTRLSEAGVSDDIAMRLGGWTQKDTARRYDHAERLNELSEAIQSAWTS